MTSMYFTANLVGYFLAILLSISPTVIFINFSALFSFSIILCLSELDFYVLYVYSQIAISYHIDSH